MKTIRAIGSKKGLIYKSLEAFIKNEKMVLSGIPSYSKEKANLIKLKNNQILVTDNSGSKIWDSEELYVVDIEGLPNDFEYMNYILECNPDFCIVGS